MNQQKGNMSLEIKKNNNNRKEISHQRFNKSEERKKINERKQFIRD